MRRPMLLALTLSLGLVAAACGGGGGGGGQASPQPTEEENGGQIMIAGEEANDHGSADVAGQTSFELTADDNFFEPTVLEGDPGQSLTIEVSNEGTQAHTFTIEDQTLDAVLEAGDRVEVEVTFPDDGAVLFICRFHQAQGMRGGLSVGGSLNAATAAAPGGMGGGGGGGGLYGGG